MYTDFYGLTKKPFGMTPDPAFLFMTRQHREALAGLAYAILERKGFLVLTGMAGSGKTTLLAWILQKLPISKIQSSVILNPSLTRDEFLEMALLDFGVTDIPASKAQRLWALQRLLLKGKLEGKVNVLVIDEAHKLSPELLEEIRLLGNFEQADEKLLQILLIGQSELDDVLARPELFQLKQRVSVRLSLNPLSNNDVLQYVEHRWRVAGGKLPTPFSEDALAKVAEVSQGIPRLINSLCDNALLEGLAEGAAAISAKVVESAAIDLRLIEKADPTPVPEEAPATVPEVEPAIPTLMREIGSNGTHGRKHKRSFLGRWVGKLGLAQ
jgi:general secretion pathway protein A